MDTATDTATATAADIPAKLRKLTLEFHREIEGEYGCPGISCPGAQRLLRLFTALVGIGQRNVDPAHVDPSHERSPRRKTKDERRNDH